MCDRIQLTPAGFLSRPAARHVFSQPLIFGLRALIPLRAVCSLGMSLEVPPSQAVALPPLSPAYAGTKRKAEDPTTPAVVRASDDADGPKHESDSATKLSRYVPTLASAPPSAADASGMAASRDPGGKSKEADTSAHRDSFVVSSSRGYSTTQSELRVTTGAWYFEVVVARLGDSGHARVGWAERLAETDAPVGADSSGYAYCDVGGEKVHAGRREPYGEPFVAGDVVGCYLEVTNGGATRDATNADAVAAAPAAAAGPALPEGATAVSVDGVPSASEGERSGGQPPDHDISERAEDTRASHAEAAPEAADETSERAPFVRRVGFCRNGAWQGAAFEPQFDRAPTTARGAAFHPSVSLYTHGKVSEHQDAKVAFNFGPTFVFPVSSFGDAPPPQPMCDAAREREATRGATE